MLNTLPTHPQTHFQQLSSLTQRQQRPANNQKSKKSKKQLPQRNSQRKTSKLPERPLGRSKKTYAGLRSMLNATFPLSTPYISPGKHWLTYKASQTKSGNMQNLDRHSFPLGFAAMSTRTPSPLQSLQGKSP